MKTILQKLMLTILVCIVICACKKDQSSENSSDNALENAKSWYLKENSKSTIALSSNRGGGKGIEQEVLWDKASLYTLEDGTEVVSAPLAITVNNGQALKGSLLLLVSRNDGVYQSKVAYSDKTDHFSSAVSEKEIGALLRNVPGKKIQASNRGAKLSSNKEKQMGGGGHQPGARLIDWYLETTYFDGNGNELYSTREYLYSDYYEPGDPQQEGNPGVISRSQKVNTDALALSHPCMVKLILKKLLENGTYSKMLQPFQNIVLPNGITLTTPGLPDLTYGSSSQVWGAGGYMLGHTEPMFSGVSSIIEFNTSAMANASQLFLQIAAIHELAHAYSRYYIKSGGYGYPVDATAYPTWAMNISSFELASKGINGGWANAIDHSLFLENYVDNFVKILKDMNGSAYTDKQYQMTAIYGLDFAGDEPAEPHIFNGINVYILNKALLAESYSRLMTNLV